MSDINHVVRHIESHLGRIDSRGGYWRFPLYGWWLQVLSFPDQPTRGMATLVSLGLSHFELPAGDGLVRQELALTAERAATHDGRLASLLQTVAETVVRRGSAIVEGEEFGPLGEGMSMAGYTDWVIAGAPRSIGMQFAVCDRTDPATRFVQLALERDGSGEDRDAAPSSVPAWLRPFRSLRSR